MPEVFQYLTFLNPLRHFLVIFLKGSGVGILWPELLALLVIGGAVLGVAAGRFRKTEG